MSVESTREVMTSYWGSSHSVENPLAEDAVFTLMATGHEYRGRQAVLGMLDYLYRTAFDAHTERRNVIFAEHQALGEWDFIGTHIGDFEGIPATGKEVRVPLCVVYDLENDQIKRGRIYLEMPVLLKQLGIQTP